MKRAAPAPVRFFPESVNEFRLGPEPVLPPAAPELVRAAGGDPGDPSCVVDNFKTYFNIHTEVCIRTGPNLYVYLLAPALSCTQVMNCEGSGREEREARTLV